MKYRFIPNDVLFFRGAKPFNAGGDSFAESMEIPFPSTIYGALRSKILYDHCDDYDKFLQGEAGSLTEVIGSPTEYGSLRIKSYGLWDGGLPSYPLPADLVTYKDTRPEEEDYLFTLKLKKLPGWVSFNYEKEYILISDKTRRVEPPKRRYLRLSQLKRYLNNEIDSSLRDESNSFFNREYRTGIKINRKRGTVEEEHLYTKEVIRFKDDYGLYLEIEGDQDMLGREGLLKVGGETRTVKYQYIDKEFPGISLYSDTKEKIHTTGLFKIYLLTPAIFKRGWHPEGSEAGDGSTLQLTENIEVEILTAAIKKYKSISGWDVANNSPKTSYRVVPAGSVFYCRVVNPDFAIEELVGLNGSSISDIKAEEGFGLIYIGGVENV